jgi:pimeloyl-ACP methyl ester carboxylesterase
LPEQRLLVGNQRMLLHWARTQLRQCLEEIVGPGGDTMSDNRTVRVMEINGAEIYVEEHGRGMPLILVHGGLGAGVEWSPVIPQLGDNIRVITPDSRGHGRSANPAEALSYTAIADDLAAMITALELDRPIVAGWSDGGQATLELAVRHPGIAGGIIVGGAYPNFDGGLHEVHRALLGADAAGISDLDHLTAELGDDADDIQSLHQGGEHHWATLIEQTASMWLDYCGLSSTQVAAIAEPALVLAGDRDQLIPLDLSIALYRALTHAELAVVPSADHSAPFTPERAKVFAGLVRDFTERHTRRQPIERRGPDAGHP